MRYLIALCFAAGFLLCIDPPGELRLSDSVIAEFSGQLSANIPSCYKNGSYVLGEDLDAVKSSSPARTTFFEKDGLSYLSWKEYNPATSCDTLVKCTFRSDVLVGLTAISKFENPFSEKTALIDAAQHEYSCIEEIRQVLEFGHNLSYVEEDLSHIQEFRLIKENSKYSGIFYEIRYPDASFSTNPPESQS